jgi:hypothetical protein
MVVLGLVFEKPDLGALTSTGWAALIYITVVPMAICYLTWFATLRDSAWQQLSVLAYNLIRSFQLDTTLAAPKARSRKRTYAYRCNSSAKDTPLPAAR